jgi:glycogen debranching enzyme
MNRRQFVGALFTLPPLHAIESVAANIPARESATSQPAPSEIPIADLTRIPYSLAGSWLLVGKNEGRVALKTVRRSAVSYRWQQTGPWADMLLDIAMTIHGEEHRCDIRATTSGVTLTDGQSSIELVFADRETLLITTHGCGLRLLLAHPASWIDPMRHGILRTYDLQSKTYFNFQSDEPLVFRPAVPATGKETFDTVELEDRVTQTVTIRSTTREEKVLLPLPQAAHVRAQRNAELATWFHGAPAVAARHRQAARTAWYLFHALQVQPEGEIRRQTVLSSKLSMNMTWSWDNCLNALALCPSQPALAWDQLFTILDHQRPDGLLPDAISDSELIFGFNKPPVWAWTVERLLPHTPAQSHRALLEEIYPKLVLFHQWWFRERDLLGDGLPCYMSGNDSGWDNASIFADRWPVQSPDLAAWLILDTDALARIAETLGRKEEAAHWRERSHILLDRFHSRFWVDGQPHYFSLTPSGPVRRKSTSLITSLPLLLGDRLDPAIRTALVRSLSDPAVFFAPAGPATESVSSPLYSANGYWRGPVWGISTYLICSGLLACGEDTLARTLAMRFCDTCARDGNFRENYDATTGAGQYDSGMTWTAADFVLLATSLVS